MDDVALRGDGGAPYCVTLSAMDSFGPLAEDNYADNCNKLKSGRPNSFIYSNDTWVRPTLARFTKSMKDR